MTMNDPEASKLEVEFEQQGYLLTEGFEDAYTTQNETSPFIFLPPDVIPQHHSYGKWYPSYICSYCSSDQ